MQIYTFILYFFYVSLKQINIFQNIIQMIEPNKQKPSAKNSVTRKDCITVDEYINLIKEALDQRYN